MLRRKPQSLTLVLVIRLASKAYLWFLVCFQLSGQENTIYRSWRTVSGDPGVSRYSELNQINIANVHHLEVAWTYRSGDALQRSDIECNPIVVNGVLYATTPNLDLIALDAGTGAERWRFSDTGDLTKDPDTNRLQYYGLNRGVAYWSDGSDQRVLYSRGKYIFAVNALTGQLIKAFGEQGRVDMREGLSKPVPFVGIANPTAGVIYQDLFIIGSRGNTAGQVRAYNVRSGKQEWLFNLIPHPGERFEETWPNDAWQKVYGANVWGGLSVDMKNGLVFIGGSADEKFRALNKTTGEILWETKLPFAAYANPSVYEIDGRQFVVIAAGGGGKNRTPSGDAYVAFALPISQL